MKFIYSVILGVVLCSMLYAQNKVDSLVHKSKKIDPQHHHLIYDYRIPDWGYHRLYLYFYASLYGNDEDNDKNPSEREYTNSQYYGRFQPYFNLYQTSEKYIFSLYSFVNSSYQYYQYRDEDDNDIQKSIDRSFDHDFNLNGNLNQYYSRLFYLGYNTANSFEYNENRGQYKYIDKNIGTTSDSKSSYIQRIYKTQFRFGPGLGRVRNVTPVFRALRFSERMRDIGKTAGLSEQDIKSLIHLFARESSYSSRYDRSSKYFYEELPKSISKQIKNLQPWEMIYLDEAFREIIGNRYEGFELDGGIQFSHQHAVYTNISGGDELTLLGAYVDQQYYHNISPGYQIGFNTYVSYSKPLNDNTPIHYMGRGTAEFLNLWNVTDRILMELNIGCETGFALIDAMRYLPGPDETYEQWQRWDRYRLSLSMDYFLENYLSIGASIRNLAYHYWPSNVSFEYDNYQFYGSGYDLDKSWSVNIDLRYYILRDM